MSFIVSQLAALSAKAPPTAALHGHVWRAFFVGIRAFGHHSQFDPGGFVCPDWLLGETSLGTGLPAEEFFTSCITYVEAKIKIRLLPLNS